MFYKSETCKGDLEGEVDGWMDGVTFADLWCRVVILNIVPLLQSVLLVDHHQNASLGV